MSDDQNETDSRAQEQEHSEEMDQNPQEESAESTQPPPAKQKLRVREETEESPEGEDDSIEEQNWFVPAGELAVDVYETEEDLVIQAPIAGIKPDNLEVLIENDIVTISGERKNPSDKGEKEYFTQECYWGPFSRQIILPDEVDIAKAQATMKNGVFTLRLPKREDRVTIKKIQVKG